MSGHGLEALFVECSPLSNLLPLPRVLYVVETRSLVQIRMKLTFKGLKVLLDLGVHPKLVQELLGHATIAMTLDTYSHYLPSMGDQAAGAMGEALG
jgi:integrase